MFVGERVHDLRRWVCFPWGMTRPLRVHRSTDDAVRGITRVVRRGGSRTGKSIVKWRRELVVQASAGDNAVPVIARLVSTSKDRAREMIQRFNDEGMRSLDPEWAGGCPRQITTDHVNFIVATAKTRPENLDRIEHVMNTFPDRCFAFDEFGPLNIRPSGRSSWAPRRQPAKYHKLHGVDSPTAAARLATTDSGVCPAPQVRSQRARRAEIDLCSPARWRTDLRDLGQPVGEPDRGTLRLPPC